MRLLHMFNIHILICKCTFKLEGNIRMGTSFVDQEGLEVDFWKSGCNYSLISQKKGRSNSWWWRINWQIKATNCCEELGLLPVLYVCWRTKETVCSFFIINAFSCFERLIIFITLDCTYICDRQYIVQRKGWVSWYNKPFLCINTHSVLYFSLTCSLNRGLLWCKCKWCGCGVGDDKSLLLFSPELV